MQHRTNQPAGDGEVDYLARYRDGDAQAFRQLVDACRDRMLQFFYRLCWDRDRAEDLAQDLFLKLLRGSKRYRPEGRMMTFVYRCATNLWIDHYRQQRPRPRVISYDQQTSHRPEHPASCPRFLRPDGTSTAAFGEKHMPAARGLAPAWR